MKCRHQTRIGLGAALAVVLLQGCAVSGSPAWDARFGDSVRQLKAQQLLDPSAPLRHADAKVQSDGRSAREARGRYFESFAAPPPSNVITIGIGGK